MRNFFLSVALVFASLSPLMAAAGDASAPSIQYADASIVGSSRLILRRNALRLLPVAADAEIIASVKEQNAREMDQSHILALDTQWQAGTDVHGLVAALQGNRCAQRLQELLPAKRGYDEAFVMDARGALVCTTNRTSDYWQGDEPKWQKPYLDGQLLIGAVKYDASADRHLVQISLPVLDAFGRRIGALTVGKTVSIKP